MIALRKASARGGAVTLVEMSEAAARDLGAAFAAIPPWSTYGMSADQVTGYLSKEEPGAPRYAITVGDTLAGAMALRVNWLRGPYLQLLGLMPQHQRQGLGALALSWFEWEARARGDRNLWVAASDFNADAIAFYERFGFRRAADLPDLIADGLTEVLLRKPLVD